jgi:hypothetical protein
MDQDVDGALSSLQDSLSRLCDPRPLERAQIADVEEDRLERVTERLNGEFQGIVHIVPIRWETEFYKAHQTFQAQIPEAAQCDIVIAIFRSRLGSVLLLAG